MQQDILAAINDPERVMQVVTTRTPDLIGASGAAIQMAGRIELDDLAAVCVRERRTVRSDDVESDPPNVLQSTPSLVSRLQWRAAPL